MYKVEKGFDMPRAKGGPGRPGQYPTLSVGESIAVDLGDKPLALVRQRVLSGLRRRMPGAKFASRIMGDVVRIWRVE